MEDYKEKINWTLDQKIFHALEKIDQFYHEFNGKVYLSFSGGKDSVLMVWLADKFCEAAGYEKIPLVFNNTTNEHKEILDFVKTFGDRVTWLRPKMTFAQSLEKNGYPLVSKEVAQKVWEAKNGSDKLKDIRLNGKIRKRKSDGKEYLSGKISEKWKFLIESDIAITSKCCDILKKRPAMKFEKDTGLKPIIGITFDEGALRVQTIKSNGCNIYTGKRPRSRPISIFTEKDVWDAVNKYKINYCSIYDDQIINGELVKGEERTGCAYCAFGLQFENPEDTKFHRLSKREPKRYKSMMDKLGYRNAIKELGIELP